ncbi:MAG: YaiO family outer membrane beta-barrel protein [Bacteroidales bacterium]|nr:YaiO family outer membrane beta-barrel protein [Bacteroidales bacterium]
MNKYLFLFVLGFILSGLLKPLLVFSQEITDPEAEYLRIRTVAFEGDYASAATDARKLVNAFPLYGDARVLLGRILAWQHDYKNATAVLDTLLKIEPDNADALSAKNDILLWSKDNTPVLTDLRADYSFDYFREPYTRFWQLFKTGMGHRFDWGPASATLNTGKIIIGEPAPASAIEFQVEAEAYPRLSEKNYAYLNYAFSPGKYFPGHKAAVEIWQVLPEGWSISAGMKYYYFDRNIFIAGTSLEKYLGKYWLSVKGFVYFKDNGPTTSGYFNARRYFNDNNWLQATLSTGTAPDEPFDIQADLMRLSANGIRIAYNGLLTPGITVRISTGYSIEEYAESLWRNRFDGGVSIIYAIKKK